MLHAKPNHPAFYWVIIHHSIAIILSLLLLMFKFAHLKIIKSFQERCSACSFTMKWRLFVHNEMCVCCIWQYPKMWNIFISTISREKFHCSFNDTWGFRDKKKYHHYATSAHSVAQLKTANVITLIHDGKCVRKGRCTTPGRAPMYHFSSKCKGTENVYVSINIYIYSIHQKQYKSKKMIMLMMSDR